MGTAGQGKDLIQTTLHAHSLAHTQHRGSIHVGHQRRTRPPRAIQPTCFRDKESKGGMERSSLKLTRGHEHTPAHKHVPLRPRFVAEVRYSTHGCEVCTTTAGNTRTHAHYLSNNTCVCAAERTSASVRGHHMQYVLHPAAQASVPDREQIHLLGHRQACVWIHWTRTHTHDAMNYARFELKRKYTSDTIELQAANRLHPGGRRRRTVRV